MYNIVLLEPEIPQNTGNIVRTCAATGCKLHLIKPLGFEISDKYLKRAGLDYWEFVDIKIYENLDDFMEQNQGANIYYFTTKAERVHSDIEYSPGDFLMFGKETRGIPEEVLIEHHDKCVRIPMFGDIRSLNLSNSVAIAVYEALRQNDYVTLNTKGELHHLKWKD